MNGNGADQDTYRVVEEFQPASALPSQNTQRSVSEGVDYSKMIFAISEWRKILNARLLLGMSLAGELSGFAFTMYDPTPLRLWGLGIFAVLCVWPMIALTIRKG